MTTLPPSFHHPMQFSSLLRFSAAGSLSCAALLLGMPSAQAQLTCGAFGTTEFPDVSAPNFSCKRGDKTYSNFSFSGIGGADWNASGTTFSYSQGGPGGINHTL